MKGPDDTFLRGERCEIASIAVEKKTTFLSLLLNRKRSVAGALSSPFSSPTPLPKVCSDVCQQRAEGGRKVETERVSLIGKEEKRSFCVDGEKWWCFPSFVPHTLWPIRKAPLMGRLL